MVYGFSLSFSYFFVGSGLGADFLSSVAALGTEGAGAGSFFTDSAGFLLTVSSALATNRAVVLPSGLVKKPSLAGVFDFLAGA